MKRVKFLIVLPALVLVAASAYGRGLAPQAGSDPLAQLPDGIGAVEVDVSQITSSDVWTLIANSTKASSAIKDIQGKLTDVGLNLSDLKSVAVSIPAGSKAQAVALVTGNFNQQQIVTLVKSNTKIKVTSQTYKGVEIFSVNDPANAKDNASFAFVDAGSAVIGTDGGVRAAIDVHAGDKPSMAADTNIETAISQTSGSIRFAIVPPASLTQASKGGSLPLPDLTSISLIFGGINITSDVQVNATLRNDTADHARAIANQLNGLLSMAKGFLNGNNPKTALLAQAIKTVTITDSGSDVQISASVPKDLLAQLIH